ncbi:MAG: MFS transporter [Clostridium sp.]
MKDRISRRPKEKALFLISYGAMAFNMQMFASTGLFMTSFALYLGVSDAQIGLMSSISNLMAVFQIFSTYFYIHFKSRKKPIITILILQYIFFFMIILVPSFRPQNLQIAILLILFALGFLCRGFTNTGVIEWNNSFVEESVRGKYFSNRNVLANGAMIVTSLVVGFILDEYKGAFLGYGIIFLIIFILAIFEVSTLLKIKDFNEDLENKEMVKFKELFTIPLKNKKYMAFVIFSLLWMFSNSLSAPYFTIYAIKYMALPYSIVAVVASITGFLKLLVGRVWGGYGDKNGWRKVVLIAGYGYAITVGLWFLMNESTKYIYPFIIIINGLCMIGINIAKFNLDMSLCDPKYRVIYMNFTGMLVGIMAFLGPLITPKLVSLLSEVDILFIGINITGYQIVFLLSGCLLFCAATYLIKVMGKS